MPCRASANEPNVPQCICLRDAPPNLKVFMSWKPVTVVFPTAYSTILLLLLLNTTRSTILLLLLLNTTRFTILTCDELATGPVHDGSPGSVPAPFHPSLALPMPSRLDSGSVGGEAGFEEVENRARTVHVQREVPEADLYT